MPKWLSAPPSDICDSSVAVPDGLFPRLISRFYARTPRKQRFQSDFKKPNEGSTTSTRWNRLVRWKIQREVESGGRINGCSKSLQGQFEFFLNNPEEKSEVWVGTVEQVDFFGWNLITFTGKNIPSPRTALPAGYFKPGDLAKLFRKTDSSGKLDCTEHSGCTDCRD